MINAEQENDARAEAQINEAIIILEELEDYYPISVYLTYMSDIYVRKKEFSTALEYAGKKLRIGYTLWIERTNK